LAPGSEPFALSVLMLSGFVRIRIREALTMGILSGYAVPTRMLG